MSKKPFIAKDTKKPLVVLGAYSIAEDGSIIRPTMVKRSGDYGADPIGEGKFRMVPSGDIVSYEERNRRLS